MSKLYKKCVEKYVMHIIEKKSVDAGSSKYEDVLFLCFLDGMLYIAYVIFAIIASISMYFFVTRELLDYA